MPSNDRQEKIHLPRQYEWNHVNSVQDVIGCVRLFEKFCCILPADNLTECLNVSVRGVIQGAGESADPPSIVMFLHSSDGPKSHPVFCIVSILCNV